MGNTSAKAASEPVTTEKIKDIGLQRMTVAGTDTPVATAGGSFPAGDLWKDQPAIVFVVRRPGCALCREHAQDLSNKQPDFAAKGVKLVGVVHEKLGVEEFSGFFKNGEIYFDEEKAFFNALGMRWEGLSSLMKPSVISNAKRASAKGVKGNLKGEGRLLGGLLVVGGGDSGIAFEHREAVFGDHASMDAIMAAVDTVVPKPLG
ncbi:unnamed protein product [Ectocarpus sp. CCAP 1310/34]|nr:unnamed protein product [Ectocarpus sp. CCAP 1310/34]